MARAEILSRGLDAAFRNRTDLCRLFFEEPESRLGPAEAEDVMIAVVERRGREVAAAAFSGFGPNDARSIGEAFLAVSPGRIAGAFDLDCSRRLGCGSPMRPGRPDIATAVATSGWKTVMVEIESFVWRGRHLRNG
ncbi:hypothetical protein [Mesorhizobium sp. CN2-181]|uniref:hypothetical protein n=1 Tax=Mesorhizobium yinganensis TaxID=3157707 RepID=UPI0032B83824